MCFPSREDGFLCLHKGTRDHWQTFLLPSMDRVCFYPLLLQPSLEHTGSTVRRQFFHSATVAEVRLTSTSTKLESVLLQLYP